MKGRKPQPKAAKRHVQARESVIEQQPIADVSIIAAPAWLSDEGLTHWGVLAASLNKLGLLDQLDVTTLASYCEAVARYQKMSLYLAEHGMTYVTKSKHGELTRLRPEYKVMNDAFKEMRSLLGEFGFSPSSRTRVAQSARTGQGELPLSPTQNAAQAVHTTTPDPLEHVLRKFH